MRRWLKIRWAKFRGARVWVCNDGVGVLTVRGPCSTSIVESMERLGWHEI